MNYLKTLFSYFFLFLTILSASAQRELSDQINDPAGLLIAQTKPGHCAIEAAQLSLDAQKGLLLSTLRTKYTLCQNNDEYFVPALIKVDEYFDPGKFKEFNVQINTEVGDIYSVHIPLSQYLEVIEMPGIKYVELARSIYPKLDQALVASKVDLVHDGVNLSQAYSGRGVVVGIIDFGFDYTHPTFCDPKTGALRIKKVWEQNTLTGDHPPGYSYGQELTEEQAIINAQTDISLSGHGTHVASIAAGSGGSLSGLYRGAAHESEIVLVSLNAREGVSGNNTGVIDGINYIFQYAESVGKAAVVNISQGHHTGPHDGSSLSDQAIDAMSGPGRIIVGAVGNEGDASGFYLHFDHTFDAENEILSYVVWPDEINAGDALVDIWGEAGTDFQVSLEVFNPQTKTMEVSGEVLLSSNPVSFVSGKLIDLEGDTIYYEGGIEINALNNRPHAQFYLDNTAQAEGEDTNFDNLLDNDFIQIRFQANRGTIHAYAANNSGEAFFTDLSGIGAGELIDGIRVRGGNPRSTMGELGGTARSIISVGGYTTKNSFTNTRGEKFAITDVLGDQYLRSSQGPTLDGRIKPDISAPANLIAAAENSFHTDFDESLLVGKIDKGDGGDWSFSIRRGTSAAAPLVAGIIALMLEADPQLTPGTVKDMLAATALRDDFTGSVPNHIWGHGKIDAAGAMANLDQPTPANAILTGDQTKVFPNPTRGKLTVESDLIAPIQLELVDFSGRSVFTKKMYNSTRQLNIDLPDHLSGVYFLQLKQKEVISRSKLVILK